MDVLTVDVISDVMCPWCYIGKRRLDRAQVLAPDVEPLIRWRPFQLDATIPTEGMDRQEYLDNKFGRDHATEMYAQIQETGEAEGISFAFDAITKSPNTINAHRLIRWAEVGDQQDTVVERLFDLFFCEGEDIGETSVLLDAAREGLLVELASIGADGLTTLVAQSDTPVPEATPGSEELPAVLEMALDAALDAWREAYRAQWRYFQRIQLNFHGQYHKAGPKFLDLLSRDEKSYIFQVDGVNDALVVKAAKESEVKAHPLYDMSGGAGIVPKTWPTPMSNTYYGYAGGLGLDNLEQEIGRIIKVTGSARIWIDMETKIRSDDDQVFDLTKVRRCLEIAKPFVSPSTP